MAATRHHKSIGPIAILKDTRQWVCVEDVKNGKKCECICPVCKEDVQSRQGEEKSWHFAHLPGSKCNAQGLLKQLAIDWFLRCGQITVPAIPDSVENLLDYQTNPAAQRHLSESTISWGSCSPGTENGPDVVLHTDAGDIDVHFSLDANNLAAADRQSIQIDLSEVQNNLHKFDRGLPLQELLAARAKYGIWINNDELNKKIEQHRKEIELSTPQHRSPNVKEPMPLLGTPQHRQRIYLKRLNQGLMIRIPNVDREASQASGKVVHSHQLLTLNDVAPGFTERNFSIAARCIKKTKQFYLFTTNDCLDETLINIQLLEELETLQTPILLASFKKKDVQLRWLFNRAIPEEGVPYP